MRIKIVLVFVLVILALCQTASATWMFEREIHINNTGNPALSNSAVYLDLSGVSPPIPESSLRIVDTTDTIMPHWSFWVIDDYVYGVWFNASYIPSDAWCNGTYNLKYVNDYVSSASTVTGIQGGFAYVDGFDDFWDFDIAGDTESYLGWTFYSEYNYGHYSYSGSQIINSDRTIYANGRGYHYYSELPGYARLTKDVTTNIGDSYNVMHVYDTSITDVANCYTKFYIGGGLAESYSSTSQLTVAGYIFSATDASTELKFEACGYGNEPPKYGNIDIYSIAVQDTDTAVNNAVIGDETGTIYSTVPDDFSTISAAIEVICPRGGNQTILVRDGTYTENIVLPTGCDNLAIISENGSASTIIEAALGDTPTISFSSNDNTTIQGFTIKDGSYGIAIDSGSSNVTISNNLLTTNFNAGLYVTGSHPNLSIINTTSSYNQDGAVFYACEQATISNLSCTYNYDTGIELQNSDHNTIDSCTIAYNADNGIELISSSDFNTILNNTIEYNNNYGLVIMSGSDYNKIYNNKFTNGANGYDEALNTWYTTLSESVNIIGGQYTGGNYYSDYSGDDDDHDGIGDTPYEITGGAIDMLPLSGVGMWVVFDAPSHLIGESVTVTYHLTDSSFGTYNYFIEVRDELNTLLETWSLSYGEDSGSYDFTLNYGWQTGEYDVYLWRTPKAGGGEVLLSQDTMTVGGRMVITGTVYDVENNITLDGVTVTFDQLGTEYTDTTAGGGTYELETLAVDKLTWINVSKDGYTHNNFTITLLATMAYEIDLYLLPNEPYRYGNAIGGVVTSYPFHQAIESATVDLSNATWSDSYTTNAFGFYSFHNITSGSYDITASKAGYSTYTPDTVSI